MDQVSHARTDMSASCHREKNLEKTIKEARLKAKKEAGKKDDGIENACDEDLNALEADFFSKTDTQPSVLASVSSL